MAAFGVMGGFRSVASVSKAAMRFRDAGFKRFDVHSPFPIHGIENKIGFRSTRLPWIVLLCGLSGLLGGLVLVWYTNVFDYPFLISGKPIFSLPANIPVVFETTVLLSAFGATFGMLLLNKLPLLYQPLFKSERFRRVTEDQFALVVEAKDPLYELEEVKGLLESCGAEWVEEIEQ